VADEWYYSKDDQQLGPVSAEKLNELAVSGDVAPSTLVWKDGMPDWIPASEVKGLLPEVASKPKPPPLPSAKSDEGAEAQLAKLQDSLIEGRIDQETYESLKADIPAAKQSAPSAPKQEASPWAKGVVHLDGKAGSDLLRISFDVFLDNELLGTGSPLEGIHLDFETTVGQHTLRIAKGKESGSASGFVARSLAKAAAVIDQVFPLRFDSPGTYEVNLRYNKGFLGLGGGSSAPPNEVEVILIL
jgi:hypothetical protein